MILVLTTFALEFALLIFLLTNQNTVVVLIFTSQNIIIDGQTLVELMQYTIQIQSLPLRPDRQGAHFTMA